MHQLFEGVERPFLRAYDEVGVLGFDHATLHQAGSPRTLAVLRCHIAGSAPPEPVAW